MHVHYRTLRAAFILKYRDTPVVHWGGDKKRLKDIHNYQLYKMVYSQSSFGQHYQKDKQIQLAEETTSQLKPFNSSTLILIRPLTKYSRFSALC